jgi:hypothetical protein
MKRKPKNRKRQPETGVALLRKRLPEIRTFARNADRELAGIHARLASIEKRQQQADRRVQDVIQTLTRKTEKRWWQWMYLDLLDADIKLENAAKSVVAWELEYRTINNLGQKAPDCFQVLADLVRE